jgi:hypothetical protein
MVLMKFLHFKGDDQNILAVEERNNDSIHHQFIHGEVLPSHVS